MMHFKPLLAAVAAFVVTVAALPQVTRKGRYLYT